MFNLLLQKKKNENEQRLLELCAYYDSIHNFTRRCPGDNFILQTVNSIILIRRYLVKDLPHSLYYNSADCETYHSLVCCKVKLQAKKFYWKKQSGKSRIDTLG